MADEASTIAQDETTTAKPDTAETESFPGSNFNRQDLAEFSADDTEVTTNIGKMLTIIFFYSLVAMAFVTAWTAWIVYG